MKYIIFSIIILVSTLVMSCYNSTGPKNTVLFDFESGRELDQVHWKCHALMSISDKHVTHGKGSLKLELYPSAYPGFDPFLKIKDWSKFNSLRFDVFNPDDKKHRITVRIDDKEDDSDYADRYNKDFVLNKGMNHIVINMDSLITSGTKRKMNIKDIHRFMFFMTHPREKVVLYVDYVRLTSS